ncbi:hypothetical protein HanRHA438_Chr15g0720131 [Helianthus annuus]|nr:hypothetical protein HanIR_Chr15g0770001 [Helianthus annuus]KAJ0577438.1 hypothetical protein HanIR_Chr05g0235991 [Helianthus annuus]KAJ0846013.1 hypothetical protein HanRHA438_Chr15g0720131 [Helianthus annuus]
MFTGISKAMFKGQWWEFIDCDRGSFTMFMTAVTARLLGKKIQFFDFRSIL